MLKIQIRALLFVGFAFTTGCASSPSRESILVPPGLPEFADTFEAAIPARPFDHRDTLRVDLEAALDLVSVHRPSIRAAEERILAAEAAHRQAGAWENPELGLEAEGFGGDRPGFDEAEVTIALRGPLDLFGHAASRRAVTSAELQAEQARWVATRREAEAQVRLAFHEVLAAREQLDISATALELTKTTEEAIHREVDAGKTAMLRGMQVRTELEAARARHEAAASRLQTARRRFQGLLEGFRTSPGPVVPEGNLRSSIPALDRAVLVADLTARSPRLAEELWRAEALHRRSRQLRRERWPDLDLSLGYRHHRAADLSDWVGGVSIALPLMDRRDGAVREAQSLERAARGEAEDLALRLLTDLDLQLEEARAASALLGRYDEEILPGASESLRLTQVGYGEGKFSFLDLLSARRSLIESRYERSQALIALDHALTKIEILLGTTLVSDSTEPDGENR